MKIFTLPFVLLLAGIQPANAQSPGGVNGTELWFRTLPMGTDLQGSYHWQDFSGDSVQLRLYDRNGVPSGTEFTQRRSSLRAFNFHPALDLSNGTVGKNAQLKYSNLSQSTIIGVFCPDLDGYATDMLLYGVDGRAGSGSLLTKDKVVRAKGTDALDYGSETGEDLLYQSSDSLSVEGFKESALRLVTYMKTNAPATSVWGEKSRSVIMLGAAYDARSTDFVTDFDASISGNRQFEGYAPELIVYSRYLTPLERRKVESYLALKYGLTLNGSYFDSQGNLVWDRDEMPAFHHRVTGMGMDTSSGLFQPLSTTSYEESPNYAAQEDSYQDGNSYSAPSESRLLVMGREYGDPMQEGQYLVWGDNDAPVTTYQPDTDSLWHVMNRTWLMKANIPGNRNAPEEESVWTGNGMSVNHQGYTDALLQEGAASGAYAVTRPFTGKDGYVEFVCPAGHPTFDVGLAAANGTTCRYGYRFNSNGSVYLISNGNQGTRIASSVSGKRIALVKKGGLVYMQINGTGQSDYAIALPDSVTAASYSAIVQVQSATDPLRLADVRSGGFYDAGFQAELGYALTDNKEFEAYRRNRTLLLLDPSGEGNFELDSKNAVRCSGYDAERKKTIFHNLFWDTDGSGSDMFTFAYYEGLLADITPYPSACQDGKPLADGKISIDITVGSPAYEYVLKAIEVEGFEPDSIVKEGYFGGSSHYITGLYPGTYDLEVRQQSGYNFEGTGTGYNKETYVHDPRYFRSGDFAWCASDTLSNYRIGLETTGLFGSDIYYGVEFQGETAYIISRGSVRTSSPVKVSEGDMFLIRMQDGTVTYYKNGTVFHTESASSRSWRFCVRFGQGTSRVCNVTVNGEPSPSFENSEEVLVEKVKECSIHRTVKVGNECDASYPNEVSAGRQVAVSDGTTSIDRPENDSRFSIANKAARSYTAKLSVNGNQPATLLVFGSDGRILSESPFAGTGNMTADFEVTSPGVYIIKAIAGNEEFTQKISVK